MRIFAVLALAMVGSFAQAQTLPTDYDIGCPLEGGLMLVNSTSHALALAPDLNNPGQNYAMRTINVQQASCPGCYSIYFDNGQPPHSQLRADFVVLATPSAEYYGMSQIRATVSVELEPGNWYPLHENVACYQTSEQR